jgi:glycosyltransferase involved in cell wall biosynthesis
MKQLANVEVIGNQDRIVIRSVLNDAAALMLTGSEVCPTMLLEAWACKTPVIAKMTDGSAELLRTYIPMDDFGGMAKGIQGGAGYHTKLDDDMSVGFIEHVLSKAEELGEQGYEQVVAHYQWKDLFERYVRLYEAVKFDEVAQFIQDHAGEGSTEEVG